MSSAQHHTDFACLLSPLHLGHHRLRNRLVHGSMTTCLARNGYITDRLVHYHRNRAVGGAAMIVTDSMAGLQSLAGGHRPSAWHERYLPGLSRLAEAVESEDCHLLGQFVAPGRARHVAGRSDDAVGPSALPDDLSWTVPHEMSADDVTRMVDEFARSSARLQRAGFSGVEFSCGHGHLLHQFLSPWSNRRCDRYGGDLDGRLTLVCELVEAVRSECGADWLIGLKVPGNDGVPGSIDESMAGDIIERLAQRVAVDYFCPVQGAHARSLEMHLPDMTYPLLPYAELTGRLRERVPQVTLMAAGRINDPGQAEQLLSNGLADLVMLGRSLLADPAWLLKTTQGREHEIRTCLSCNTCWGVINERRAIQCVTNPRVGEAEEIHWVPVYARERRRIAIIGAGVAGLEVAAVAAQRGHEVTVYGATAQVGGKLGLLASLPGCDALANLYANQYPTALDAGVQFELGAEVTVDEVIHTQPDDLVLACGSSMNWPDTLPNWLRQTDAVVDLRMAVSSVLRFRGRDLGCAVIFDQDHSRGTYAAAELFAQHFARVVIVTPREMIARDEPTVTRQRIYQRLYERRVEIILLSELAGDSAFEQGEVSYSNVYNGDRGLLEQVSLLTYSTPRSPVVPLPDSALSGDDINDNAMRVHCIGDSHAPRGMLAATRDGHALGMRL